MDHTGTTTAPGVPAMSTATLTQVITVSIVGLIAGLALLTRLNKRTRPTLQNFPTGGLQ